MEISVTRQVASFAGALSILIAYAGSQTRRMNARGATYNLLNLIGSAILAYIALHPFQVGFVVMEFTWAVVSAYALLRPSRKRMLQGQRS